MSDMSGAGLAQLVQEIKLTSCSIEQGEARTNKRLESIESSVNELYKRSGRAT